MIILTSLNAPSPTTTSFRFTSGRLERIVVAADSIGLCGDDVERAIQELVAVQSSRGRFFNVMPPSTFPSVFWPKGCTKGGMCYGWLSPAICVAGVLEVNHLFYSSNRNELSFLPGFYC